MAELRCKQESMDPELIYPSPMPHSLGMKRNHVLKKHFLPLLSPLGWVSAHAYTSLFRNTLHALLSLSGFLFTSRGRCKKSQQTQWLKTTEIDSFPIPLKGRRLKSVSPSWNQGVRGTMPQELRSGDLFLPLLGAGGCGHSFACGCITPISVFLWPSPLLCGQSPSVFLLQRHLWMD